MESVVTVSQINRYIKLKIDHDIKLSDVSVKGEISNFIEHQKTGHLYFTLKDNDSSIKALMFKQNTYKLKFPLKNGEKVIIKGNISVFERDGTYQIYAKDILPDGEGDIYANLEKLKQKLNEEGLFSLEHKRKIPKYPDKIGIVTSKSGAAIEDMLNILNRRYPLCNIYLYPALVQGDNAAKTIINGIKYFNKSLKVDTIIIGRGGGSAEDLWCFNDETLAREIYNSEIPIISAVGHEIDFTISDFVADLRAPTPSAAAELCTPDIYEIKGNLNKLNLKAESLIKTKVNLLTDKVKLISDRPCLKNSDYYLLNLKDKLNSLKSRNCLKHPEILLENKGKKLREISKNLKTTYINNLLVKNKKFSTAAASLDALSPLKVLGRGYSIVSKDNIPVGINDIEKGDNVTILFDNGQADAKIISKKEEISYAKK